MNSGPKNPNADPKPLVQGRDFYYNEAGLMVLTEAYLKARGYCCESGCRHCPYGYKKPGTLAPKPTSS